MEKERIVISNPGIPEYLYHHRLQKLSSNKLGFILIDKLFVHN